MSDSTCKICGGPVPSGMRYCSDCDFQHRKDGGDTRAETSRQKSARPHRERGSLSIFLLVFLVASGGTIGMGVTATPGLSIPGLKATLGIGAPAPAAAPGEWGEVRFVDTRVRIRADRSTDSQVVGMLDAGQRVRTHFLEDGWYAVFDADAVAEDQSTAIGFVYAPLLKPDPDATGTTSSS